MSNAHQTWIYIKRAVVIISSGYCLGFFILVGFFVRNLDLCANQASTLLCVSPTEAGVPVPCLDEQQAVQNIQYYEAVWAGVVVVIFSLYTYLFNGIVYAILSQNWRLSHWQHMIKGSKVLRLLLKPFMSTNILTKEEIRVSGELREWRQALRSLGMTLAFVSIASFVLKAVLQILMLIGFFANDVGLQFALSTICAEGIPSTLTLIVLLRYHSVSAIQDAKNYLMKNFYGGSHHKTLL